MVIDIYTHVITPRCLGTLEKMVDDGKTPPFDEHFSWEIQVPGLVDVKDRFKLMDNH